MISLRGLEVGVGVGITSSEGTEGLPKAVDRVESKGVGLGLIGDVVRLPAVAVGTGDTVSPRGGGLPGAAAGGNPG